VAVLAAVSRLVQEAVAAVVLQPGLLALGRREGLVHLPKAMVGQRLLGQTASALMDSVQAAVVALQPEPLVQMAVLPISQRQAAVLEAG
jgi:hypothetical protein